MSLDADFYNIVGDKKRRNRLYKIKFFFFLIFCLLSYGNYNIIQQITTTSIWNILFIINFFGYMALLDTFYNILLEVEKKDYEEEKRKSKSEDKVNGL